MVISVCVYFVHLVQRIHNNLTKKEDKMEVSVSIYVSTSHVVACVKYLSDNIRLSNDLCLGPWLNS
jgi:hypothetical protein